MFIKASTWMRKFRGLQSYQESPIVYGVRMPDCINDTSLKSRIYHFYTNVGGTGIILTSVVVLMTFNPFLILKEIKLR